MVICSDQVEGLLCSSGTADAFYDHIGPGASSRRLHGLFEILRHRVHRRRRAEALCQVALARVRLRHNRDGRALQPHELEEHEPDRAGSQ
jgi:hypothetical protein